MKKLLVTLTPAEGKRLIAKGILALEPVQKALKSGYLCVTLGTTNSYIVEEIIDGYDKTRHVAGVVVPRGVWLTRADSRATDAIFHKGEYIAGKKVVDVLSELGSDDVILKGANALDADFVPLVLLAHQTGGSIGAILGAVAARNIRLIMPVGLEKYIPTRHYELVGRLGVSDWDYAIGKPVGVIAVPEGIPFTEIEAFNVLFGVSAVPIAAGGVNGAEGAVTFLIEGEDENIDRTYEYIQDRIKGEELFPTLTELV
ncbi:MAG: hypothetical protein QXQ81_10075 [Candidatus Thorarchaeota archaeon]